MELSAGLAALYRMSCSLFQITFPVLAEIKAVCSSVLAVEEEMPPVFGFQVAPTPASTRMDWAKTAYWRSISERLASSLLASSFRFPRESLAANVFRFLQTSSAAG